MKKERTQMQRQKSKARSWLYRLRQSIDIVILGSADFRIVKSAAEIRLGKRLTWDEFITNATLEELLNLDDLRNELRAGI